MSSCNYSVRVGAGPEAAIHPAVLIDLGVSEGGCVDFALVNGVWQLSGRKPVSTDYFGPEIEEKLSQRLESIEAGAYVEIRDVSEYSKLRAAAAG
jgi:hypothetical protein